MSTISRQICSRKKNIVQVKNVIETFVHQSVGMSESLFLEVSFLCKAQLTKEGKEIAFVIILLACFFSSVVETSSSLCSKKERKECV